MNETMVVGSVAQVAQQQGATLAETFINVDYVVMVDTSGSMGVCDSRGGKSRYDVACEELEGLQKSLPGKLAVISFSNDALFCPGGVPINMMGGTDMAGVLRYSRVADVEGIRFFMISDGYPDDERSAMDAAKKYQSRIDGIYVGPEEDPRGRDFLERLAAASGGKVVTADKAKELSKGITYLIGAGA